MSRLRSIVLYQSDRLRAVALRCGARCVSGLVGSGGEQEGAERREMAVARERGSVRVVGVYGEVQHVGRFVAVGGRPSY